MKRRSLILLTLLMGVVLTLHGQAKYVFYFIGDGMGVNQVAGTELYMGELQDTAVSTVPLRFAGFPYAGLAVTHSATHSITDSAAGGTALSTGTKTYNGALSVDAHGRPLTTVAELAKRAGRRVGIATSVSIDHATPAAFYAHRPKRSMYYEVACDLPVAGFDFYAGAGFLKPETTYDKQPAPSIYPLFEAAGYTLARGLAEYRAKASAAKKLILMQEEGRAADCLPYAIDRTEGDLTLEDITRTAVDFLTREPGKGFFLMVEGGKIDWACHDNDGATALREVQDLDQAIAVAYEFYKKHPKETLIVVTADHETGGLALGNGGYTLNLKALNGQQCSAGELSKLMNELRREEDNKVSWEEMKEFLSQHTGLWTRYPLTWKQERALHDEFENTFVKNQGDRAESLYARSEPLAARAKEVLNQVAGLAWGTNDHSAAYVPVFAIGAGAHLFQGRMDNTDIPRRIMRAAGY